MTLAHALHTSSTAPAGMGMDDRTGDRAARARHLLARLLEDGDALLGLTLSRRAGGYARTFLFGDEQMSAWVMTWDVGSATPIHDHHCACCFGILAGQLVERRFADVGTGAAARTAELVRCAGYSTCLEPDRPNIHQMLNLSGAEAVSIHIYGFDRHRRVDSIAREYRAIEGH